MINSVVRWRLAIAASAVALSAACVAASDVSPTESLVAEILADTNRDGVISSADRVSSPEAAIILPNIGDVDKRCPGAADESQSDAALEACHDAQDDVARAPEYFAPLRLSALPTVSAAAIGTVRVNGAGADQIRIFLKQGEGWQFLDAATVLSSDTLRAGAELGVDARDIIRDRTVWDGRADIAFEVIDDDRTATSSVPVQVAPVILHNHLETATTIFAPQSDTQVHEAFMQSLDAALDMAAPNLPLKRLNTTDNWAQDFVEFGYLSMPAPDGAKTIRVAIRSPQPTRSAGRALFDLKGPGFGVVQTGGDDYHQADSFGNLETIPPYEHDGKAYPAGRVIYGDAGDGIAPHTDFTSFFDAQAVQDPILLDTSWLIIAHVDEFLQFLPADTARGWTIAIKDVPTALALLHDAQANGHGETSAFSIEGGPSMSINELLADAAFLEDNERARRRVEMNLERLLAETGLTEAEVIRIPGLFERAEWDDVAPRASVREKDQSPPPWLDEEGPGSEVIVYGPGNLLAFYPAPVNGILLDADTYILPKQWGPVIGGVDILEAEIIKIYAEAGITAWPVDAWYSHHVSAGEIHCGTNVTRTIESEWWAQ
ncbi:MAG: protein-arginine deiminase domain-containing protein [Hyphomonadaceae bacterium]|nr:protein-arginine deiminase domain-containing protein [Hyphomonadaceae bacterium]